MSELVHYGMPRRSGRYPWGSGGDNSSSYSSVLTSADNLANQGFSEKEIAKALGMSTGQLRNEKTLAKMLMREEQRIFAQRQRNSGMSTNAISTQMGIPEATVRSLLAPGANLKFRVIQGVAKVLRAAVSRFKYIDIGEGVERFLGISETKLGNAVSLLTKEGYTVHYLRETQLGTGKKTSFKILAAPGVEFKEVYANRANIQVPNAYSVDKGHSFTEKQPITNISMSRVKVVTGPEGIAKDGLIELRRTPELDMGPKKYAQVRIGVEGTHYLKGMAVHTDNIPSDADVVFYTSKSGLANKADYLKTQDVDSYNPFGSTFTQKEFLDSNGKKQLSAVNIVNEEGDWSEWDKNLATQFLSKQAPRLAQGQLDILYQNERSLLDDIQTIPNPTVRSHMLVNFSDNVDKQAVHLKAAAMPRQTTNVLIPSSTVRESEVFAPNYRDGEQLVLVRYPHGGVFEIPNLTVNNRNPEMRNIIGADAPDAIGIHPNVAKKLSGADFDGDFVLAIPNPANKIRVAPSLEGLKDFDPITSYPAVPGMKSLDKDLKELKMGDVSNLITDMTIRGAPESDIARAVRHSMVVIDAEKHNLNYQQSYHDNGIAALKKEYQGAVNAGSSTLISKTTSPKWVPHRDDRYLIDKETGEKIWRESGEYFINREETPIARTTKTTWGADVRDAHTLSSGTVVERVYADHSNKLRDTANEARRMAVNTKPIPRSPSAARTYANEVKSLNEKFTALQRNRPLERKAQLVGGELFRQKKEANPNMARADYGKERSKALATARIRVGLETTGKALSRPKLDITSREWEAINMNALSPTRLATILQHVDTPTLRELSLPSPRAPLAPAKQNRALVLLKAGYTAAEVADAIGASQSQILNLDK